MSCYYCHNNGVLQRCAGCRHAFYCSRDCQRKHWKKHKPNCIPPSSSLHDLFDACFSDVIPCPPTSRDYGFENVRVFHKNVPDDVKSILLGVYQAINRDIGQLEYEHTKERLPAEIVLNNFGASKRMMLEAYESNSLDAFIQRFVRNLIERYGGICPRYCFDWLHYKLIIGPTRQKLSDGVELTAKQVAKMRDDIYRTYYE